MKIICISDLHSYLPDNIPECDLLLIAGDICATKNIYHEIEFLDGKFRDWLNNIPAKKIILISGNHDLIYENNISLVPKNLNYTYLKDSFVIIDNLKIYGSPWQPIFLNWAFNLSESELKKKWNKIPSDTDILLLHGPPYGIMDWVKDKHIGSPSLYKKILDIKPKYVIFGHNHDGHGILEQDGITFINCSILDSSYNNVFEPISFEINI